MKSTPASAGAGGVSGVLEFDASCHRYTVDKRFVPSVTQVLEAAGRIDLSGIHPEVLRRAGERGTVVHAAVAHLMRGSLDWSTVHDSVGGYVRAAESFIRHTRFRPRAESVERPFYCAQFDYCGTPDVDGDYPIGSRFIKAVVDYKTGMMSAVRYQLAAYAFATGKRHRVAVKLNSDGTYSMVWFPPETLCNDFTTFLADLHRTRAEGVAA